VVPNCRVEYAANNGPDKRCYRVDCRKIAVALPHFQPVWNARKGAKQLYAAYMRTGIRLDDFEGPRYKRVEHIKHLLTSGALDETLRRSNDGAVSSQRLAMGAV
jgi:hypothetical protein